MGWYLTDSKELASSVVGEEGSEEGRGGEGSAEELTREVIAASSD